MRKIISFVWDGLFRGVSSIVICFVSIILVCFKEFSVLLNVVEKRGFLYLEVMLL